jgi:glycosyltransferase involved in cell wall biosynthesis
MPEARVRIVGQPARSLVELSEHLGLSSSVHFEGDHPFPTVKKYLAAADVVVLPRRTCVGFPLKLLNYMAAGKAVVSFYGSGREVITSEQNGVLVRDGDERAFAAEVASLLIDPDRASRLGHSARETARNYGPEVLTKRVHALYRDVLGVGRDLEARVSEATSL